jgi:uncharacterized protein
MEFDGAFIQSLQPDIDSITSRIADELTINKTRVTKTVTLLEEGNTVPFISRYRKEQTGSLDEVAVRSIQRLFTAFSNLENRKIEIIQTLHKRDKLTRELHTAVNKCITLTELEELYKPYKQKKKTRGMKARESGLEPLAEIMLSSQAEQVEKVAPDYINSDSGIDSAESALQGAMDILAERFSENIEIRRAVKSYLVSHALIHSAGKGDVESSVYQMYYDYSEPLKTVKPHRILAINRGETEKELSVTINWDENELADRVERRVKPVNRYSSAAVADCMKRLMLPSLLREIRHDLTTEADAYAIKVFEENLHSLLMQPPIKGTRIIGIDPGIRTGSKAAVLDETGKYLASFTFKQLNRDEAISLIAEHVNKYSVELIAVGNGTGTRDVQEVVAEAIKSNMLRLQYTVVSEDGASVYSASEIAREEFPDLDLTIRGAVSIARRLQDPLSELVKIDPRSIGVGLYQHDVNQKNLSEKLDEVVESVVNNVGVNVNTASWALLRYVSGVSASVARNIVTLRDSNGQINSRTMLKKVNGMGARSFEQAAGFLRVPGSNEPLDNTWVHPENYRVGRIIYKKLQSGSISRKEIEELTGTHSIGKETIQDIIDAIKKPGLDPRDGYPMPVFKKDLLSFDDLREGMKVTGTVKNVVNFGAFVDIGLKETALLHISEMSNSYIKDPLDFLHAGDVIDATIIKIDEVRKRISLSMKER